MIRVVPALDVDAFAPVEFPVVVVVLVAYGVATGSLDRLVVGGIRSAPTDRGGVVGPPTHVPTWSPGDPIGFA